MGDVIGDINARRGRIEGMDDLGGGKIVRAYVPLSEMFGYSTDLRSKMCIRDRSVSLCDTPIQYFEFLFCRLEMGNAYFVQCDFAIVSRIQCSQADYKAVFGE